MTEAASNLFADVDVITTGALSAVGTTACR